MMSSDANKIADAKGASAFDEVGNRRDSDIPTPRFLDPSTSLAERPIDFYLHFDYTAFDSSA